MTPEQMIEQFAEMRAAQGVTNFMLMEFLQHSGCNAETLARTVAGMITALADVIENDLRKNAGLPPRPEPRPSILDAVERDAMGSFDWTRININ